MISYSYVTSCRKLLPGLRSLDAVRTTTRRCLPVYTKRQHAAEPPFRHRHDESGPVRGARCPVQPRFYSDIKTHKDDLTNTEITGCSDVSFTADSQAEEDLRQRVPQVFNIEVLVALLRQENGVDICVIKVPASLKYVDYFVVVSGSSRRHLIAMAEYAVKVYKAIKSDADSHVRIEGKDAEDWMCIDFGHIVVHFMLPETREVYELEKLWTLRSFDEQLSRIPPEILPQDFIYEEESTNWRSGFGAGGGMEQL